MRPLRSVPIEWDDRAVSAHLVWVLLAASVAAFALAGLSAVAGFGGGVVLLPIFTALFGLRVAVPVLTLAQLSSNGSRAWLNREEIRWRIVARFAVGAVPLAVAGGLIFAAAPLGVLKRVLGLFLIGVVVWRRWDPQPRPPRLGSFVGIGAASGFGSAVLGSVGPITAPFFLAYGLVRGAYIGTEAVCALSMHGAKIAAYGGGQLLSLRVLLLGAAITPATLAGAWSGKRIADRLSDAAFARLVEAALLVAGVVFVLGV
ncbi:MAG: hypothetical protein JWN20_1239 [Jatrophihabitantaceae bacterium]|nr:hypothetical protein [Jatrophihabitantaceae bacterium]